MAPLPQENEVPTPSEDNTPPSPPSVTSPAAQPDPKYWTKANIATTTVFALLTLTVLLILLAFFLRKRSEKKKKRNHRKSDHVSLLHNEDKTSMFSRERHSSVTLYLDHDEEAAAHQAQKRGSQDALTLTPLQITPLEDVHDPMSTVRNGGNVNNTTTASNGSGVSSISRLSTNTTSTIMLSPITPDDGDSGSRPSGRPRSTSTASVKARYYDTTPTNVEMPPIPKIVRTPSD